MRIRNLTPFAQLAYANEDAEGRLFDILIVKQSYHLAEGCDALVQSIEQEPLNFSDACFGEVNETSLRYPSDLVPYKPATDVIVIADAHAPGGKAREGWDVSVQVGEVHKAISVTGPREWAYKRRKWRLGPPKRVLRVPLRYEKTYGGQHPGEEQDERVTDERNPLGCGTIHRRFTPRKDSLPAPQVLAKGDVLDDPFRKHRPVGFGPVPPAWLPRRKLGGTYDQNWIDNIWPHWAPDYDFAFHNSAAQGMKPTGFLQGDEEVVLRGLHPKHPEMRFALPGDAVIAHLLDGNGTRQMVRLNLDTLYIDILDAAPEDCLISLTWRMTFLEDEVSWLEIDSLSSPNPVREMAEDRRLHPAPHPSALFGPDRPKRSGKRQKTVPPGEKTKAPNPPPQTQEDDADVH